MFCWCLCDRIIPAYAGCTLHVSPMHIFLWDHPRIRGVHAMVSMVALLGLGSSPHTRGARSPSGAASPGLGIIPAYAGCTRGPGRTRPRSSDHPRIRGVHWLGRCHGGQRRGSSPHTRGAPQQTHALKNLSGIIPAYAGCTVSSRESDRAIRDHPRIRGVHVDPHVGNKGVSGSSPHTRGARRLRWS